ncbi:MAG: phosphate acyltransferase PlsX, partial [Clostridia bacterium]|nr:phosphate acyltransferase PlsX [Clostridia bacterium]
MALAFKALSEGRADAFVSAGSTGAIVVGGTLIIKRIKGIKRPALAGLIPSPKGHSLLMDMGANAECRPEMLEQFGIMASAYLSRVEGIDNPKIGLLNIGVEDSKGGELQKEAYKLLSEAPINFVGNIESREMPKGVCDAVITDGFTGNIALKLIEGTAITFFKLIKNALYKNIFNKLAALVIKKDLYSLKSMMDSSEVGGAPLLGVKKPVIKAHGSSDAKAIKNAIRQAVTFTKNGVIDTITEQLT